MNLRQTIISSLLRPCFRFGESLCCRGTDTKSMSPSMFASPVMLGRQPWCYDQVWRNFLKAAEAAGIGKLGTHSMRHTYRSWLDAAGTGLAVQQKLMRHGDIRTTMNVYGDVVTDEMRQANSKVVQMALAKPNWFASDLLACKLLKYGGSEWESNPPATGNLPPAGFEDRENHRAPCASRPIPSHI
jgi:hypothetical protein